MTIGLALPADRGAAWIEEVEDRFRTGAADLLDRLGLPASPVVVSYDMPDATLDLGAETVPLDLHGPAPRAAAEALATLREHRWEALLRPALAARGIADLRWLRHAALRGLTVDQLATLAVGDADEETVAWRLASETPPLLAIDAGRDAMRALAEEDRRRSVSRAAAERTGLPVPFPAGAWFDPGLEDEEASLVLGAVPGRAVPWYRLEDSVAEAVPALVDPGLVLALLTDGERVSRRLAALALRRAGAVAIAREIILHLRHAPERLDLTALLEHAGGLA